MSNVHISMTMTASREHDPLVQYERVLSDSDRRIDAAMSCRPMVYSHVMELVVREVMRRQKFKLHDAGFHQLAAAITQELRRAMDDGAIAMRHVVNTIGISNHLQFGELYRLQLDHVGTPGQGDARGGARQGGARSGHHARIR